MDKTNFTGYFSFFLWIYLATTKSSLTGEMQECLHNVQTEAYNLIKPKVDDLHPICEDHNETIKARCIIKWTYCSEKNESGDGDLQSVMCQLKEILKNSPNCTEVRERKKRTITSKDDFFKCWCFFISKQIKVKKVSLAAAPDLR